MIIITHITNTTDHLAQASESVKDFCDWWLYIDTGLPKQWTDALRTILDDTEGMICDFEWIDHFAAARNYALDIANSLDLLPQDKSNWLLYVDNDQEYNFVFENKQALQAWLDEQTVNIINVWADGYYYKPVLVRLGTATRWVGATHEYLHDYANNGQVYTKTICVKEGVKTPEQLKIKFERDKQILEKAVHEDTSNARNWYYLGSTYESLKEYSSARAAYTQCRLLSQWDEEAAWAAYRIANTYFEEKIYYPVVDYCIKGLASHAGMAELYWLAGLASFNIGLLDQAQRFGSAAAQFGYASDIAQQRVGFRELQALYEGPWGLFISIAEKQNKPKEEIERLRDVYQKLWEKRINE